MFFFNRFIIFIYTLMIAILMVSCQGNPAVKDHNAFSETASKDTLEVKRLLALSEKNLKTDLELSLKLAIQATKISEKTPFHTLTFDAFKTVAKVALNAGVFEILETYLTKFLYLAKEDNNEKMIGRAYANLAMLHLYLNEIDVADSLFSRGLALIEHHAQLTHEKISAEDQIIIYLNLGHIKLENKQFMKAEIMYQKGLKIAQSNAVFLLYEGQLLQSLSLFYLRQRQVSNAKKYLDLGLAVQKQLKNEAMIPVSLLGYGQYYELIHLPNQARLSYEKGLELAKNVKSVGLMIEFSKELYRMHKAEGNSEQALYYLNLNLEQNTLSKKEKAKEALFRKTIERNILEQEAKEKNSEKITSIYLITSVLLIVILLVYFIRRSATDHEKINLLRNEQVDKIKLQDALELTHQKLAKNALEAIQKEESLNQIVEKIKVSKEGNIENSRVLNTISNDLEKINKTKNWDEFEKGFVGIHANFFPDLLSTHPDLTNNERRLCAFLKIDLSTREIAKLTGQTIRAIELSRIRLRKKLQLTNSELGLYQYLSKF